MLLMQADVEMHCSCRGVCARKESVQTEDGCRQRSALVERVSGGAGRDEGVPFADLR